MISFLRTHGHVNPGFIRDVIRDGEWEYKRYYYRYISEIPADFMSFIRNRDKAEYVRNHLFGLYGREPKASELAIVTRRLVNLAALATHSRDQIEDRLGRAQYKHDNWNVVGRCQVCGLQFSHPDLATVDHVLPMSLGGEDDESNWELLCLRCNSQKGHRFACCDLSRTSLIENANFFNQALAVQLALLENVNFPLRYELFELMNRQCTGCNASSKTAKLVICITSESYVVHSDNLIVLCEKCTTFSKIPKKHQLR